MNWVGGVRDRVHRNSHTLMKQKEHFEKKRLAKFKRKGLKNVKKGVSRDILNLDCISKTVRNPFDDEVVEQVYASGPSKVSKLSDTSASSQDSLRNRHMVLKKQFPNTGTNAYKFPQKTRRKVGTSSNFLYQNKENYQNASANKLGLNAGTALYQSTPLPFKDSSFPIPYPKSHNNAITGNSAAAYRKFNMLSPIPSQESFQSTSILPITFLSELEPSSTDQHDIERSIHLSHHETPQSRSDSSKHADETRYIDLLHGVASYSNCATSSRSNERPSQVPVPDHFSQYEMINDSLLPQNSPKYYSQQLPKAPPMIPTNRLSVRGGDRSYSLFHSNHPTSHFPCDSFQVKQEQDDESIFVHSGLMSSSYHGDVSGGQSSNSSPTHYSSLFTSSKSSASRKYPSPVSSPDQDPSKLFDAFLVQKTQPKSAEKAIRVKITETVDASTSPILWPKLDVGVQTSDSNNNG